MNSRCATISVPSLLPLIIILINHSNARADQSFAERRPKAATTMRNDNYYTQRDWMMQMRRYETSLASAAPAAENSASMHRRIQNASTHTRSWYGHAYAII